jgi:hypothetical protein
MPSTGRSRRVPRGSNESYLREKFGQAISGLATGTGTLQERVRNAMVILVMFRPEQMPDQWSREEFAKLDYLATDREAVGDEGQLKATIDAMSDEDVQALAQSIVQLHDHLIRRTDKSYAAEQ